MHDAHGSGPGSSGNTDGADFLRRGHFVYESGDHGDTWLALELLFADPDRLDRAAGELAERLAGHRPDFVCGPVTGGALLAQGVARALGTGFVYAEREAPGGSSPQRYVVPPAVRPALAGKRVAIVDDAINAGAAARACVVEIEALGGTVVALACWVVRADAGDELAALLGHPIASLHALSWSMWPASDCPLCRAGHAISTGP
jgi:orotate phosphoribosyltransferase